MPEAHIYFEKTFLKNKKSTLNWGVRSLNWRGIFTPLGGGVVKMVICDRKPFSQGNQLDSTQTSVRRKTNFANIHYIYTPVLKLNLEK